MTSPARRRLKPGTLVVGSFAATILVGTLALRLPGVGATGPLSWHEALFTATSATCVTGLTVVDTATDLSRFGQALVLVLIQVGGLGILTFSTLALVLLGREGGIRMRQLFQDVLQVAPDHTVGAVLRRVVALTLGLEAVGALVLFFCFRERGLPVASAAGFALFHSVSALCNAGFALFSDSLESYRDARAVTATVNGLIILGGLGFLVLLELPRWVRSPAPRPHLTLHARVVLVTTGLLLAGGAAALYLVERSAALADQPPAGAWAGAFFHAVNARTAGFNSIPLAEFSSAGLVVLMALMFIGGSPGSVAGGVKTTTVAIFGALCYAWLRGRRAVTIGRRTVPAAVVQRAVAMIGISGLTIAVGIFLLLLLEHGPSAPTAARVDTLGLAFEAVSAFGTVGLSTGITASLQPAAQLVLVLLMFAGRVGPLTLAFTLLGEPDAPNVGYPEEPVMIG